MEAPIQQENNGNTLICALCTILIVSLIGANVLVNCARHYNVTAKQLKGSKEALYAAEAGGDVGFDEVRKLVGANPTPTPSSGWTSVTSPTPGPAWSKTISGFGQGGNLSATVTIDKLTDNSGTLKTGTPFYRIRSIGTAKLFGLPRTGLSDQFFAGGPNFVAKSATRGIGDTLLRKIDFKYDHFKATYGDGDGNAVGLSTVSYPQVTRRIELVAVPKYYVFGGAMRLTTKFDGPGSAGNIDSYDATNPNNTSGSSYWGPNPNDTANPSLNPTLLADAHDGDVSVGTGNFSEGGPIWGDVTTNGGNVTHSGYRISGTIDNNVPFTVKPLSAPDATGYTASSAGTLTPTGTNELNPEGHVYSSITGTLTIKNGNASVNANPYSYVRIVVNGDITGKITVEKGVTAQIFFTGNMDVKGRDIDNQNVDLGRPPNPPAIILLPGQKNDDPDPSAVGHLQFYGISPASGTQTIHIAPPGNVLATFYAPSADITLTGNPDMYGAVMARSFSGNGNTGFHYDKWLNNVTFGVVDDYQIASYVEDAR